MLSTSTSSAVARVSVTRARGTKAKPSYPTQKARGATRAPRSLVSVRAQATADELIERAKTLTEDLKAMRTTMPTIRRVVAGNRNDLVALQLYQDALEGKVPIEYDDVTKLERTLDDLATYVQGKAEEEQFWSEREGQVTSSITDNSNLSDEEKRELTGMVSNVFMYGVQGATWNAILLLIGFVSLVTFVLPNQ
jgi:hypothetical protein